LLVAAQRASGRSRRTKVVACKEKDIAEIFKATRGAVAAAGGSRWSKASRQHRGAAGRHLQGADAADHQHYSSDGEQNSPWHRSQRRGFVWIGAHVWLRCLTQQAAEGERWLTCGSRGGTDLRHHQQRLGGVWSRNGSIRGAAGIITSKQQQRRAATLLDAADDSGGGAGVARARR
jgi:hypothetical protein